MEILYKLFYLAVGVFIITLFLYNHMKENVLLKKKIVEGNKLSDTDIDTLKEMKGEIAKLKAEQAGLLEDISKANKRCSRATSKLSNESKEIDEAINKTENQADEAKSGKSTCD